MGKDPWIRELRRGRHAVAHVVFLPHAGGAATYFLPFARHLPETFDVSAVQYPGRQERLDEPLVPTVELLADRVADSLRRYAGDGTPLVLFGHSMGASVAYEAVLRLAAGNAADSCRLVVSGRGAPSAPREILAPGESDRELLDHLVRLGGTDAELIRSPELMELFLPALRNDYRAVARYRPAVGTAVDVPVLCLTGEADPQVTVEEAAAWKAHTSSDFLLRTFPGGHFFLIDHVDAVTGLLTDWAGPRGGGPAAAADGG
ncbi:alpha/beta fold hydrolase [Streptomyces sp. NPDC046831]|uniref:thioesterase II family protein n=1 Tax=Streptomyces sp. NPDC046831 TaxID=3154805 RepID=UPI0033C651DD